MTDFRKDAPFVAGISGASGAIYGVQLIKALHQLELPTHLIVTPSAEKTLKIETGLSPADLAPYVSRVHDPADVGASIASGSFLTRGMVIAPCSIKTLSGIANAFSDNLLIRAADITLKERRPLILMVRETPLHKGHLDLMAKAAELGAIILPPMPAFYHGPKTIDDLVRQIVGKALDALGIEHRLSKRWTGA